MKIKRLYAAAAALLLLLPACKMMGPEPETGSGPEGKAAVRIGIGIQGRTVLPAVALTDVTDWELWGGKPTDSETLLKNFSGTSATVYLETGSWNFTLKGYNSNDELILRGSITGRAITLEGPNTLSFEAAPLAEGQGTFKITLNLPSGHGITAAEVWKDGTKITAPAPVLAGDTVAFEDTYAAGDYYFSVRLDKGADLYGVVSELAQVRGNLRSEKTYTLSPADLSRTYVITYHLYDAVTDTGYYWTNSGFTLPIPARTDHLFAGWYDNPWYTGSPVTVIPQGSMGDKDFYAKWIAAPPGSNIVTFKKNDGTEATHAVKVVASPATAIAAADFPANPARTDYVFAGWNTQAGGGGSAFTASTPVYADMTVYAQWTEEPLSGSYTVIFMMNDGTETHHAVKTLTPPAAVIGAADFPANPARTDYVFVGWNTQDDGLGSPFTASTTVSGDTTVYAKWMDTGALITLNPDAGDGTFSQADFTLSPGGSQTVTVTGSDYASPRWFVDGELKGITNSITLNAADYGAGGHTLSLMVSRGGMSWSKELKFTVNMGALRTVIFRTNDGTGAIYALKTTTAGTSLGSGNFPAPPPRTGYTFTGWNTQDNGGGTAFTTSDTVSADTVVYAQWTAHAYTVTFDKTSGDTEADPITKTVTFPAAYIDALPAPPTRTNYNFAGWNTQADGSGTAFTASTPVTANITVYALWSHAEFAITLNLDAGVDAFSQADFSISSGGSQTVTITGSGYANPRWFVDGDLKGTGTSITINAADYGAGGHTLSLMVSRGGVSWSKELKFTITP